jgi:hypothetical protein
LPYRSSREPNSGVDTEEDAADEAPDGEDDGEDGAVELGVEDEEDDEDAVISAARSLADSASDCTLSRPVSSVDLAFSTGESVRPPVERVLPYSSH